MGRDEGWNSSHRADYGWHRTRPPSAKGSGRTRASASAGAGAAAAIGSDGKGPSPAAWSSTQRADFAKPLNKPAEQSSISGAAKRQAQQRGSGAARVLQPMNGHANTRSLAQESFSLVSGSDRAALARPKVIAPPKGEWLFPPVSHSVHSANTYCSEARAQHSIPAFAARARSSSSSASNQPTAAYSSASPPGVMPWQAGEANSGARQTGKSSYDQDFAVVPAVAKARSSRPRQSGTKASFQSHTPLVSSTDYYDTFTSTSRSDFRTFGRR